MEHTPDTNANANANARAAVEPSAAPANDRLSWVRAALAAPSTMIEFPLGQEEDARQAAIHELPSEAQKAVLAVIRERVCNYYCEHDVEADLGRHMRIPTDTWYDPGPEHENDESVHSYDWRLRVYRTDDGTLYDFNGWPGDNECGGAIFYPKIGGPFEVFTNLDEDLHAADAAFREAVAAYARRREAENQRYASENPASDNDRGDE